MNKDLSGALRAYTFDSVLKPGNRDYDRAIKEHLLLPLQADLGKNGDITTEALLPSSKKVKAVLLAKQPGVLAGMEEIGYFLKTFSSKTQIGKVKLSESLKDGSQLKKGSIIAKFEGNVSDILKFERTLLNFLQHMSGVATLAHEYVEKSKKYPVLVCTTRKTPWGLLDKRAAVVGGAATHRLNLSDAVLVKDTHLDFIDHDFEFLLKKLTQAPQLGRFVEVEVESISEARKALKILRELLHSRKIPCALMLDNMKPGDINKFMNELSDDRKILVEASGGITLENIQKYADAGVDILSVGAITHSAPALDISLKITPVR